MKVIDRKYDCVPREDLAKGIAGAAIGLEDNWETQEDFFYIVECTYNEERYEWIVIFTPRNEHTISHLKMERHLSKQEKGFTQRWILVL